MIPRSRRTSPRSPLASRIQLKIHAEGEKTESQYLTHWNRLYRENAIISIATHEHTTPVIAKSRAQALAMKHEGEGSRKPWNPHSNVWKLVDVIMTGTLES